VKRFYNQGLIDDIVGLFKTIWVKATWGLVLGSQALPIEHVIILPPSPLRDTPEVVGL
jgi:hypothetical protein